MISIEEVWTELGHLNQILGTIGAGLNQTAKDVVQQLKQDPASVKEYPLTGWAQDLIQKLTEAGKLEPQEVSKQIQRDDNFEPLLLKMTHSYLEVYKVHSQQLELELAKAKIDFQESKKKVEVKQDYFNVLKKIQKITGNDL